MLWFLVLVVARVISQFSWETLSLRCLYFCYNIFLVQHRLLVLCDEARLVILKKAGLSFCRVLRGRRTRRVLLTRTIPFSIKRLRTSRYRPAVPIKPKDQSSVIYLVIDHPQIPYLWAQHSLYLRNSLKSTVRSFLGTSSQRRGQIGEVPNSNIPMQSSAGATSMIFLRISIRIAYHRSCEAPCYGDNWLAVHVIAHAKSKKKSCYPNMAQVQLLLLYIAETLFQSSLLSTPTFQQ